MDHNYWNVDDFIADSQRLPCTFNIDVPNMGQIQSNEERDIKALSRVELPFWLAELMALNNIVSINKPKSFSTRVKAALDANPTSVQLRHQNIHWYALGARLAQLMDDDDTEMQVLSKAYIGRIAQIFQQSQHLSSASASAADNADGDDRGFATAQAIAAMVSDGPTLGMSAGNAMSAEITEFLQGMEESERMLLRNGQEGARMIKEFMAGHH
ncbi:related to PSF3-subunit of the GINS complex [Sporisorium reilianum f. sp. reilianum]|uniref:DNA replication complex GINS protein PSF3 n=1 Tax=Sporisorium reilianum f. sp. reilianum TaxID=72559 RepID=A0A2N8U6U2_9BASI|nr:related to PSF3-subunit of the GINS complex [Sporisorium reilianum f. sp. reilianum]